MLNVLLFAALVVGGPALVSIGSHLFREWRARREVRASIEARRRIARENHPSSRRA